MVFPGQFALWIIQKMSETKKILSSVDISLLTRLLIILSISIVMVLLITNCSLWNQPAFLNLFLHYIAGVCITCCSYFESIFNWFESHVLHKWAATSECRQPFILCDNKGLGCRVVEVVLPNCPMLCPNTSSLSFSYQPSLVSRLSQQITLEKMWKVSRDIVAENISVPFSASHRLAIDSSFNLQTPAMMSSPKYAS